MGLEVLADEAPMTVKRLIFFSVENTIRGFLVVDELQEIIAILSHFLGLVSRQTHIDEMEVVVVVLVESPEHQQTASDETSAGSPSRFWQRVGCNF